MTNSQRFYSKGWKQTKLEKALKSEFREERNFPSWEMIFLIAFTTGLFLKVIHYLAA